MNYKFCSKQYYVFILCSPNFMAVENVGTLKSFIFRVHRYTSMYRRKGKLKLYSKLKA